MALGLYALASGHLQFKQQDWELKNVVPTLTLAIIAFVCLSGVFMFYSLVLNSALSWLFTFIEKRSSTYQRIKRYESATVSYRLWLDEEARIQKDIEDENARIQEEYWWSLGGYGLEQEVASLYTKQGFKCALTSGSGDGGVDLILRRDGRTIIVQCKAHRKPVGPHVIRDLHGTLIKSKADEAIELHP